MSKWLRISECDYTLHATAVLDYEGIDAFGYRYEHSHVEYNFRWTDKLARLFVRGVPRNIAAQHGYPWWMRQAYYRWEMAESVWAVPGLHWLVRLLHWGKWKIIWSLREEIESGGAWRWKWEK